MLDLMTDEMRRDAAVLGDVDVESYLLKDLRRDPADRRRLGQRRDSYVRHVAGERRLRFLIDDLPLPPRWTDPRGLTRGTTE
jgi:hypothetical protein